MPFDDLPDPETDPRPPREPDEAPAETATGPDSARISAEDRERSDPFADFREEHRRPLVSPSEDPSPPTGAPETPRRATEVEPSAPRLHPSPSLRPVEAAEPRARATADGGTRRIAFVLHAHLPWVLGHGRWPHGEEWLTEAALHCYLPLVGLLRRLGSRGHRDLLTVSITPVLAAQLADPRFPPALERDLAARTRGAENLARRNPLGRWWIEAFERLRSLWEALEGDLPGALRTLEDGGVIELSTSAATHPYLPLLHREEHVRLQLAAGRESHRDRFGRAPRGIWMPECAYRPAGPWRHPSTGAGRPHRPGLESFLEEAGFRWTVTDAHLLLGGEPFMGYGFPWVDDPGVELPLLADDEEIPLARRLQPVFLEDSEVVAFFREPHTARQVWARQTGYPGDPAYLDFHKRHEDDGLRLWRVTNAEADLGDKLPYWPPEAAETARRQADHFVSLLESLPGLADGVALCPYDAELFGHWWFEGPDWLELVLERIAEHPRLETATPSGEVAAVPAARRSRLSEGSWGEGGDHRIWLAEGTEWMWRDLREAEESVHRLLRSTPTPERSRAAIRQLMLLAASDWPFLVTMGTATDYAIRRFQLHRDRLRTLIEATDRDSPPSWIEEDLVGLRVEPRWWSEGDS